MFSASVVSMSMSPTALFKADPIVIASWWLMVIFPPTVVTDPPVLSKTIPVLLKSPPEVFIESVITIFPILSESLSPIKANKFTVAASEMVIPSAAIILRILLVNLEPSLELIRESSDCRT